jgi:5'-methylthioadenosine phosphorylase
MEQQAEIGIIGGSGLYDIPGISDVREVKIETPFGAPSDKITLGVFEGVKCAFLPRHGKGHRLLPTEVPSKANIWALKSLGCGRVISISAVGSLREDLPPRDFVMPDQLVDETKHRQSTFFGDGVVAHIAYSKPFCGDLLEALYAGAKTVGVPAHKGGTYVCMEGPAFSTRAESLMHRKMGYDIIGMTAVGEARLAREAELCYAAVAMVTDYDCWKEDDEVSTEKVIEHLMANAQNAQKVLKNVLPILAKQPLECPCTQALKGAIFTRPEAMNPATVKKLDLLIGKYVKQAA